MIHKQVLIQMAHIFSTKPLIHQSEHGLHTHTKRDRLAQKRRGNLAASQQTEIKACKL